jgi:hypothetical protein
MKAARERDAIGIREVAAGSRRAWDAGSRKRLMIQWFLGGALSTKITQISNQRIPLSECWVRERGSKPAVPKHCIFSETPYHTDFRRSRIRRKSHSPAASRGHFVFGGYSLPRRNAQKRPGFRDSLCSKATSCESGGGESGIRTHGTVSRTHAFQACALSHSAISPEGFS